MFSFFKKKKKIEQQPCLKIDIHSHLIPCKEGMDNFD